MKKAIVIIGYPNSGKTSTIKHFVNGHKKPKISNIRTSYQRPYINASVSYDLYCIPSSPTESGIPLIDTLSKLNHLPEFLLMAEQRCGDQYQKSIKFLQTNNYEIEYHEIFDSKGSLIWERFDKNTQDEIDKLDARCEIINKSFKDFLIRFSQV